MNEGSESKEAVYERTGTIDRQRRIKKRLGRKDDGLIKGRSKSGLQEERGRKREEMKKINGV